MVRLHRFGDKDDEAAPNTPSTRLPSYVAMCELASADNQVSTLLLDERWQKAQAAFGTVEEPDGEDGSWRQLLDKNSQGNPEKSMKNLKTMLLHDPRLKGKLRQNLFSGRIDITGDLPWARPGDSKVWGDEDIAQLRIYTEPFFGKVSKNDLIDAMTACASDQAYHPVRDYLKAASSVAQWWSAL